MISISRLLSVNKAAEDDILVVEKKKLQSAVDSHTLDTFIHSVNSELCNQQGAVSYLCDERENTFVVVENDNNNKPTLGGKSFIRLVGSVSFVNELRHHHNTFCYIFFVFQTTKELVLRGLSFRNMKLTCLTCQTGRTT